MTTEIPFTLDDDLAAALAESGRPPAQTVRERLIYDLYRDSALSVGTAARLLVLRLPGLPVRSSAPGKRASSHGSGLISRWW